jgi:hypothetical protein
VSHIGVLISQHPTASWLATVVSAEETSTQVEVGFTRGQAGLETARLRRLTWHREHRNNQHHQPAPEPDDVG